MSLFLFDDAKVRRFFHPAMDNDQILHKNYHSFDVNQEAVLAHRQVVRENIRHVHESAWLLVNEKSAAPFL